LSLTVILNVKFFGIEPNGGLDIEIQLNLYFSFVIIFVSNHFIHFKLIIFFK